MLTIGDYVPGRRDDDQKLSSNEELRLMGTKRAQADQAAEERELREADRARRRRDERADAGVVESIAGALRA